MLTHIATLATTLKVVHLVCEELSQVIGVHLPPMSVDARPCSPHVLLYRLAGYANERYAAESVACHRQY